MPIEKVNVHVGMSVDDVLHVAWYIGHYDVEEALRALSIASYREGAAYTSNTDKRAMGNWTAASDVLLHALARKIDAATGADRAKYGLTTG